MTVARRTSLSGRMWVVLPLLVLLDCKQQGEKSWPEACQGVSVEHVGREELPFNRIALAGPGCGLDARIAEIVEDAEIASIVAIARAAAPSSMGSSARPPQSAFRLTVVNGSKEEHLTWTGSTDGKRLFDALSKWMMSRRLPVYFTVGVTDGCQVTRCSYVEEWRRWKQENPPDKVFPAVPF